MRSFLVLSLLLAACDSRGLPGPNEESCRDLGFCDATQNLCACGTSCSKHGARYACEMACDEDTECAELAHPVTGAAYTQCVEHRCQ